MLVALAFTKLLSTVQDAIDAIRESLAGHDVPFLLAVACDDLQQSLYGFTLLPQCWWNCSTVSAGCSPHALMRTFAQADVEVTP